MFLSPFGLTAAPLWGISSSIWPHSRASPAISNEPILELCCPSRFLASCFDTHSPWIITPPPQEPLGKQTCTAQTPILYLCHPSLGSQVKNRTALEPIFFSFHTHFALLSQHSLQTVNQACFFGFEHNASSLPILSKMLPCFALIGKAQGCSFYPCWCCISYNAR